MCGGKLKEQQQTEFATFVVLPEYPKMWLLIMEQLKSKALPYCLAVA
jgi:hypothetical protein